VCVWRARQNGRGCAEEGGAGAHWRRERRSRQRGASGRHRARATTPQRRKQTGARAAHARAGAGGLCRSEGGMRYPPRACVCMCMCAVRKDAGDAAGGARRCGAWANRKGVHARAFGWCVRVCVCGGGRLVQRAWATCASSSWRSFCCSRRLYRSRSASVSRSWRLSSSTIAACTLTSWLSNDDWPLASASDTCGASGAAAAHLGERHPGGALAAALRGKPCRGGSSRGLERRPPKSAKRRQQ
jgi:hypothetical protein